jgi:UDP-N-acetylmuramate dehydrogenase
MAVSLRPWHTFKMSATADSLRAFATENQLLDLIHVQEQTGTPFLVVGHGSNLIFTKHFSGAVWLNRIMGFRCVYEDDREVVVEVGSGVSWHHLVVMCLSRGWYGLENLISIPGTVGAAPVQNIGAYGVELADVFESCRAYSFQEKDFLFYAKQDCAFGYRTSVFKQQSQQGRQVIITSVRLRLSKLPQDLQVGYPRLAHYLAEHHAQDRVTPALVARAVRAVRLARLPNPHQVGTVGSFFINPVVTKSCWEALASRFALDSVVLQDGGVKLFAGNILRICGFAGYRQGGLCMTPINPMVIVNDAQANYGDLAHLLQAVEDSVQEKMGLSLEVEPNIW